MSVDFKSELSAALAAVCRGLAPGVDIPVVVERPNKRQMGDFASPVAMRLAPILKQPPRQVAESILQNWTPPPFVLSAEVAGAGFVNIRIRPQAKTAVLRDILQDPQNFGRGQPRGEFIHLEFVSANPTGPLHIGHGRGAAYGDSLARILARAGHPVATEYYLNDAGLQISILTASVWLRHLHSDSDAWDAMPKGSYRGAYLRETAAHLREWLRENAPPCDPAALSALLEKIAQQPDDDSAAQLLADSAAQSFGEKKFAAFKVKVRNFMTERFLKADLNAMGVRFDRWFSENDDLRAAGKIEAALDKLRESAPGSLYEKDGALWFRAEKYGDEKDRVARRSNGEFTYFAADIAYCEDKFARETPSNIPVRAVYVLGADHHGYAPRLRAAAKALGRDPEKVETPLIQFVALKRADALIPMSTRAGRFVSLRELLDAVGADAARYFFAGRKNDQRLDFDLQTAVAQNPDNPVYYLQYMRARAAGVLRKMRETGVGDGKAATLAAAATDEVLAALTLDEEMALCEMLGAFGDVVSHSAEQRAPHLLANWLRELAAVFHAYYSKVPALSAPEPARTARAALLAAAGEVAAQGLELLGVSAPEIMSRENEGAATGESDGESSEGESEGEAESGETKGDAE